MEIVYYALIVLGLTVGVYDDKKACDTAAAALSTAHCERRVTR